MGGAPDIEPSVDPAKVAPVRRGHRLGRYVLCYELASGGMATVYLGRATGVGGFEKLVALKIIHPHLAKESDFVEMFLDEARIAARINHPNVCSVFDFGKEEDTYFLAMEYLVGETCSRFARALARRPDLSERFAVPALMAFVIQQACEGLHAAHELRADDGEPLEVVHRDMTPHNLFLGYDGSVRVVDFGVASAVGRMHETNTGTLKGKFAYMSPEQIRQEKVDRRSDVWSLGVSFWELLTRRRLFRRDGEYDTLRAVMEGAIPPPSEVRPGLPPVFDAIVARALERDIERRYPSAREMGRDLARAIGAAGGASTPDLADLMEELFRDERTKSAELVEKARTLDPEQQSSSRVMVAPVGAKPAEAHSGSMPSRTIAVDVDVEPKSGPRRWPWAVAVLVAVLMAGLGAVIALGALDDPAPVAQNDPGPEMPSLSPHYPGPLGDVADSPEVADAPEPADTLEAADPAETADSPEVADAPDEPADTPAPDETPEAPEAPAGRRRARSRAADRPAAAVGNGTVNVVTPPGWAEIYLGGRRVGRSPAEIRVPAGRQRIRLLPYGEEPAIVRTVEVENGGTARLVVRLEN